MIFKIILSILFIANAGYTLGRVGQEREPIEGWEAFVYLLLAGLVVYGLWKWC